MRPSSSEVDVEAPVPALSETIITETPSLRGRRRQRSSVLKRAGVQKSFRIFNSTERLLYKEAQRLQKRVARLNKEISSTKAHVEAAKKLSRSSKLEEISKALTPFQRRFFENQLRNTPRKPKGRSFTFEDKADSIAIWKSSPRTYKLLSKMFTLPSIGTLRSTLRNVQVQPGISKPMFEVLKRQVARMRKKQTLCTLLFDEIALQPHLDNLPHEDRVVGFEDDGWTCTNNVADHACVFMLRGIFKRWKQPVAFAFCKSSMTPETIVRFYKEIVKMATEIGLNVVVSICDQGTNNVKALNLLREETRRNAALRGEEVKNYNIIIVDDVEVIALFDPPHLLKSIRNNLLTKKLRFTHKGRRMVAQWSHIEAAYRLDRGRGIMRSIGKLSEHPVVPGKIRKMKVSLCAQVFSHSVASFMDLAANAPTLRFTSRPLPVEAGQTAVLIKFLDSIFDSVNGGFGRVSGKILRGLVGPKSPHLRWWIEGKKMFSEMRFIPTKPGDRARPPVLDGWYRTLDGFILIRQKLLDLGYHSFPARAFNQDPLENFFGQVRQYGVRYNNPTCRTFLPFYKSLLIRTFSSYHSRGSNCEHDEDSLLVNVRDFLNQGTVQQEESVDRWRPPSPPSFDDEADLFERNAVSYVGGFILKRISPEKYDCQICLQNLQHSGELDPLHHQLTSLKEYDDVKRLRYININLVKVLLKIHKYLDILIPSVLHCRHILKRVVSHVRSLFYFDFLICPHMEELKSQIFTMFVKISIFGYMRKLSHIIFGKETPSSPNQLEQTLGSMYLRFRGRFKDKK